MDNLDLEIEKLEEKAQKVLSLLKYARRAFVLEFAGTPKAGKSTSVEAIRHFFNRAGFKVHVLTERAESCPIPMKGHLFFNAWCTASMLAQLLENIENNTDIMIVDRGLFDALVWLTMQRRRGEITQDESDKFRDFVLLDRWLSLTDLVVAMSVDAETALDREQSNRISMKKGSIMNTEALSLITDAVNVSVTEYGRRFKSLIEHTTEDGIRSSNIRLAHSILDRFEKFLDPDIMVLPKARLEELQDRLKDGLAVDGLEEFNKCIELNSTYMKRSLAEANSDVVQIVAAVVLTHCDEVFMFERKEKDPKSELYGKSVLWQGGHVVKGQSSIQKTIKAAASVRVNESLYLGREFDMEEIGYCWTGDEKHLGVIFRMEIENDFAATDLRKKEFRKSRGHDLSGKLISWSVLSEKRSDFNFEPWSENIISNKGRFGGED